MSTETPQIPDHESVKPEGLFDRLIQFSIHNRNLGHAVYCGLDCYWYL